MQQIYEGKEVYGHQLTAHVDKKGIIKSVSGESAQNLEKEDLKNPINLSKEEAKQYIYTKYGNDIQFISDKQKLRKLFLLMKIVGKLQMHIKLHLQLPHQNYVSWNLFSGCS